MNVEARPQALVFLFLLAYVPFVVHSSRQPSSVLDQDLLIPYSAAHLVYSGHQSPYDYRIFSRVGQMTGLGQPQPYLYPPPSLFLFFPFSLMSFETAKLVMLALSHGALLIFLYLFALKLMSWQRESLFLGLALVYTFVFHPLAVTLTLGQVNIVLLLLLVLAWLGEQEGWPPALVALPLTLAVFIKIYPVLFLVYFLLKKKYATFAWAAGFILAASLAALFSLPPGIWSDWITFVLPSGGYGHVARDLINPAVPWNQSINGFFSRLLIENGWSRAVFSSALAARVLIWSASLAVVVVSLGISYLASKAKESRTFLSSEFSVLLLAVFLVAPFSWDHHLVMVLPAVLFALHRLVFAERRAFWLLTVGASALILAWGLPLASPALKTGLKTLAISLKFYAAAWIWIFLVWRTAGDLRNLPRPGREPA